VSDSARHVARDLLRVDLTAGTTERTQIPDEWLRKYVGGKGLGARYLYEHLDPGADPLGPANVLLFTLGPLSGLLPGETRYAAITKSPLTGTFLDSYSGGDFPVRLAGALDGCLGVVVTGAAAEPVQIVVEDGTAAIEPAETWGCDTVETARAFPDAAVACIGPAGENRVAAATISSDEGEHHAGRGGAGAVMGAKRLKAVVARGEPSAVLARGESCADPRSELKALRAEYAERYRDSDTGRWLRASGTVESVDFADEIGGLATRGWTEGQFEGADDVGISAVEERASGREYDEVDEDGEEGMGEGADGDEENDNPGGFRVETEAGESVPRGATAMSLGAGLGIDDFDAVAALGERCNRLGMDLVSAGSAVAWAIRAAQAGVIDDARLTQSTQSLSFGDPDAARELLSAIATRETELGDALADGVATAAERFGGAEFVPTVKAMELPAYDPRATPSMALAYATSDRGACHRRARPVEREPFDGEWTPEQAASAVVREQNRRSALWCLIADDFVGESFADDFTGAAPTGLGEAWLDAIGFDTAGDLETVGERVWTLTRLFNVREGFDRADDTLPAVLAEPLDSGPHAGEAVSEERFDAMLSAYYARRGWGPDGRPARETLAALGLERVLDDETPVAERAVER
jgi:aldehyde:ferredoxin oxidoreductase